MAKNFFSQIPVNHEAQSARSLEQAIEANKGQLGYQVVLEIASRPNVREGGINRDDWRTLLNPAEGYSREEWASHLRKEGHSEAAHVYELGATATVNTAIIPVEEHAQTVNTDEVRKTSFAYLVNHLPSREMAREFHEAAQVISGQDPSSENKLAITSEYLTRINLEGQNRESTTNGQTTTEYVHTGARRTEADRMAAAREVINEMKELADTMRTIDSNFRPDSEDIMDRGAARGDGEMILERVAQNDEQIERLENETIEERTERIEYGVEAERENAFNPLSGAFPEWQSERAAPEDEQMAREESIEMADTIEIDPDLDRVGTVFATTSNRITNLDNVARLPMDNQIVTPSFIVGDVLPRINESLRQGTPAEQINRDARDLSFIVTQHLDRREQIEGARQNPDFAAALEKATTLDSREGVQQFIGDLSQSNLPPSERILVLQSQALRADIGNQFTEAVGQLSRDQYKTQQAEALSIAQLYVADKNELAERPDSSFRERQLPNDQLNNWKSQQTTAIQSYTDRAVEFMQHQTSGNILTPFNQAAEQISSARTVADTMRVATEIANSDKLTHDDKRVLLLPGAHTSHHTQQQEYALSNTVRDYNASHPIPIRFDNVNAERLQIERESILVETGHLQTINDALVGKRTETEFPVETKDGRLTTETRTTYAISATPDQIKGEYREMAQFVEKYTDAALREDPYLRNSNQSKFFRLAHEQLALAKDEARVEKVSDRILQANTQLAKDQREGSQTDPEMQKLTHEQRALLSLPGPHTQHYSEQMLSTMRDKLIPSQERYAAVQTLMEHPEKQSEALKTLTGYLQTLTDKNGHPSDSRIGRMITVMKTDPANLTTPPSKVEQQHRLAENFQSLDLVQKDFLHKQIVIARAEALVYTPERASQRTQEAHTAITSSRDTATLNTRLEQALSREGTTQIKAHEALYLKNTAKDIELNMDKMRDEGQRKFGEPPVRSESYRTFITELKSMDHLASAPGVRVVSGEGVVVCDKEMVGQGVARSNYNNAFTAITEKYETDPNAKATQVLTQTGTLKQLQADTLAARDAYQNHNERIIERVTGEKAGHEAQTARFETWSELWKGAMRDTGSPAAIELRQELQANKQALGETVNEHVKGKINQPEFERRTATFSDGTREFLADSARQSEMAGDVARFNTIELSKETGFREQTLQQATPMEREYQTAYKNSMETTQEKFYQGFEKLDTLIAQADGKDRDLERPEPERERESAERTDKDKDGRDDRTGEIMRTATDTDGRDAVTDIKQLDYFDNLDR